MTRGMIYKLCFIVFLILFAVTLILPTIGEKTIAVEFLDEVTAEQMESVKKRFSTEEFSLKEKDKTIFVSSNTLTDAVMNEIRSLGGVKSARFERHWAEDYVMAKKINLGLDLQGGMHLVLRANFEKIEAKNEKPLTDAEKNDITQQALELLRNRIDKFGVSEPSIRPRGYEAIEIQLPGVKDPMAVKKAIGTTGRVEYRLVDDRYSDEAMMWKNKNLAETPISLDREEQNQLLQRIAKEISLPKEFEVLFYFVRDPQTKKVIPSYPIVLQKEVGLAGSDVNKAWVGTDEYGGLAVHFTTTAEGALKFAKVTDKKNFKKRMAIVIDDNVRSAPSINQQISGGQAIINGDFTQEEVNTLARIIKEGALPVDLKIIEERTVGPTLGQDSIEAGVKAFTIGLLGVMLFMILYYKLAGIIADLSLIINMTFLLALLSWMGFTLTLPGIAGLILTVGMAVDANVIIYERIKEEIASGKSVRMSILYGYEKAFWTIFDSNLTTIIAAFILSQFGTGPIKGFAVTLFIGILTSMFSALFVSRFVYEIISLNKKLKKLSI
jgi:preprotein translocase subunit SecD